VNFPTRRGDCSIFVTGSLRRRREYCRAGYTTVVQDNIFGDDVLTWLKEAAVEPTHLVVLRPSVTTVQKRDAARRATLGKGAYRAGTMCIKELDELLATTPRIGLWLDTSALNPEETVKEILSRCDEAVVKIV